MRPLYLDYNATTPLDPRVFEAMKPYFLEEFGNGGSRTHVYGQRAKEAVERARSQVADRMPHDLHGALLRRQEETGQSLNDLLIEAAARLVGVPVPPMPKGIPGRRPGKLPEPLLQTAG